MTHLLVTGASGYLGSRVTEELLKQGHRIIAITPDEHDVPLPHERLTVCPLNQISLEEVFNTYAITGVFHFATCYGRNGQSAAEIMKVNLLFPLTLLELAVKHRTNFFINTDTILKADINSYALTKNQFFQWLTFYADKIKTVNMRLDHFYGPKEKPIKFVAWLVKNFKDRVDHIDLTEGSQTRDFIYIDDVVRAYLCVFAHLQQLPSGKVNTFECGSGVKTSIKNLVNQLSRLFPDSSVKLNFGAIPYRKHEILDYDVDISHLQALGWRAQVSLEAGLKKVVGRKMNPLLSVCIPTYNRATSLKCCLDSFIAQAERLGIAVYISDNHCEDDTPAILAEYQKKYPDIIHTVRQSATQDVDTHMWTALRLCQSLYALWLGDDDQLVPDTLPAILQALESKPDLCVLPLPSHPLKPHYRHADDFFHDYGMLGLDHSMQFSTLVVNVSAMAGLKNPMRYKGTMHLYAGVIFDYLAEAEEKNQEVNINVLPEHLLILSNKEKRWEKQTGDIFLEYIPEWISLLPTYYHHQPASQARIADFYNYINTPLNFWKLYRLRQTPLKRLDKRLNPPPPAHYPAEAKDKLKPNY